jgi:hypothetical protein
MLIELYPLGFNINGMCAGTARQESVGATRERQSMRLIWIQNTALDDFEAANKDNEISCTYVSHITIWAHLVFFNRKWYLAHEFTNNTARENYLGYMSRMTCKIKNYSQSYQLVRLSLVTIMLQSVTCAPARSLTRSLSCLRCTRTRRNLETLRRNFILCVLGREGILFVPLGLHLCHIAAWNCVMCDR